MEREHCGMKGGELGCNEKCGARMLNYRTDSAGKGCVGVIGVVGRLVFDMLLRVWVAVGRDNC